MRKLSRLFICALLAFPVVGVMGSPAHVCTDTTDLQGCDRINQVCQKFFKSNCVG